MSDEHPAPQEHDEHRERPAGSGTTTPDSDEKHQAGSYSRDAGTGPERGARVHRRAPAVAGL